MPLIKTKTGRLINSDFSKKSKKPSAKNKLTEKEINEIISTAYKKDSPVRYLLEHGLDFRTLKARGHSEVISRLMSFGYLPSLARQRYFKEIIEAGHIDDLVRLGYVKEVVKLGYLKELIYRGHLNQIIKFKLYKELIKEGYRDVLIAGGHLSKKDKSMIIEDLFKEGYTQKQINKLFNSK
jgi:hypothetical protein